MGFFELLIIVVIALVVFGPKKLPALMEQAGRAYVHVRRATEDLRSTFEAVVKKAERDMKIDELRKTMKSPVLPPANSSAVITDGLPKPLLGEKPVSEQTEQ